MPRSKSKLSRKMELQWDESNMILAVKAVMENEINLHNASLKYCIPRSTLYNKILKLKSGHEADLGWSKKGRKTVLSEHEENTIAEYAMVEMQGLFELPKLRTAVRELAFKLASQNGDQDASQKNGIFSSKWLRGFVDRHPHLSILRLAEAAPEPTFKIPSHRPCTKGRSTSESYYNNVPKVVNQPNFEAKEDANTPKPSDENESKIVNQTNFGANHKTKGANVSKPASKEKTKKFCQTNFAAKQRAKKQASTSKPSNFAKAKKSEPLVADYLMQEANVPKKSSEILDTPESENVRCSVVSYDPDGGKWVRSYTCDSCDVRAYEDYYDLDKINDKYVCMLCSD